MFLIGNRLHDSLRVRITFRQKERKDKTSILGERYYNLFIVTHIGIIYFDKRKFLTKKVYTIQNVLLLISKINCVFSVRYKIL